MEEKNLIPLDLLADTKANPIDIKHTTKIYIRPKLPSETTTYPENIYDYDFGAWTGVWLMQSAPMRTLKTFVEALFNLVDENVENILVYQTSYQQLLNNIAKPTTKGDNDDDS